MVTVKSTCTDPRHLQPALVPVSNRYRWKIRRPAIATSRANHLESSITTNGREMLAAVVKGFAGGVARQACAPSSRFAVPSAAALFSTAVETATADVEKKRTKLKIPTKRYAHARAGVFICVDLD
jgi:hypothetical protein